MHRPLVAVCFYFHFTQDSSEKLFNVRDCDTNSKNVEASVSELTWGCEGATQRKAGERDRKHLPDKPLGYLGCLHAQLTPGLISCGSFREAPFTGDPSRTRVLAFFPRLFIVAHESDASRIVSALILRRSVKSEIWTKLDLTIGSWLPREGESRQRLLPMPPNTRRKVKPITVAVDVVVGVGIGSFY